GLKTFILKVREIGLSVKLDTNGTHPEVLKDLMRDHLIDYIAMDIKSEFTVEAYSKATGIEVKSQLLDKVMQSVRLIIDSGIKHEFRTTLCKELVTAHNMKEMIASLKGCDRYYMQKLNTDKTLEEYAENFTLYTRDEIREQIEALHSDFPIGYRE
ncbi:MAG: hypothetical protein Q8862_11070, partial [Bacteroidota bacterium]|nr:hypothetical protein [Bacteroidota bacterium]